MVASDAPDGDAGVFAAPGGAVAPLERDSAVVHVLETTRGPIPVHPGARASLFEWLPRPEAAWVVSTEAAVLVPIMGSGVDLTGVLVIGRRFDDRMAKPADLPFLETMCEASGIAIEWLRLLGVPTLTALGQYAPPARECPVCQRVSGTEDRCRSECGAACVEAPVPAFLAGKFRMKRRLGTGRTGVVYLARDIVLQRDVAIKTLEDGSASGFVRLKHEARALAVVEHAAIARIHGVESWRDRPLLVLEFLPAGTLADRIRRVGRIRPAAAIGVAMQVASALAAVHAAGYLHGDVKPSNIGFAADGSAKLLDFGLAHLADDDASPRGGTAAYMSPETLAGRSADAADDVWSLGVVLYEMVSGRPWIRRDRLPDPLGVPNLLVFAESMLTAERSARPPTARAFADALRAVSRG